MCVGNITHTNDGLVVHVRQNLDHGDDAISSKTKPLVSSTDDARITSTAFRWNGTAISSLHSGLHTKLLHCLRIANGQKHILKTSCGGDACDYLRSLKMYLHGMIHNLYVQAFKLLPASKGALMRSILVAGHCYGPCDPLSNIILNSIWHDTCGSVLSSSDRMKLNEYNDVMDPLSLLRLVVRSLEGLAKLALFADPQSSIACTLEKLCSLKCIVLVDTLSSATKSSEKNPFHEAAMAARHPLPLQLGEFHQMLLLEPDGRRELLSHITKAQTSGGVGPKYELDFIFGVEQMEHGWHRRTDTCHHVNFMATSDENVSRTLFYAEFWSWPLRKPKSDPEFCRPLPYAYAGRCYYDEVRARKIVYPDDGKYFRDDITYEGTGNVDGVLQMDLVHFSSELDVELARNLNMPPTSDPEYESTSSDQEYSEYESMSQD
uniref:Uncharacterized protein n=1 Tax=Aegilops tauschii TaxID=37682 RepID=M8C347_AEGTA